MGLKLTLLGGFDLRHEDGRAIELAGAKDRALLAFIAIRPGIDHPREKAADLLWGEHGEAQARDSLKHALIRLRQALGSAIQADRRSLRLEPGQIQVDVAEALRLLQEGSGEALKQAAQLCRGEFLEELNVRSGAFDEWLQVERPRLRQAQEAILGRLIEHATQRGDLEAAADAARRMQQIEPLHEGAGRALMQLLHAQGRSVEALRLYERLRAGLQGEFGVAPEPATTQLYQAIRAGRAASGDARNESGPTPNPPTSKPAVAVLPFSNLSDDPGQQYFSDGITDDIITELSRFRPLLVIARQSCFAFRGTQLTVPQIAAKLGVAYIVEGSVRRSGDRVRINAQLVDAALGSQLWAERYDRALEDIFAVQDEVARAVAAAVSGRVEVVNRERVVRLGPTELHAYDLVLRARAYTLEYTRADNARALACAERAAALDPSSARAAAHAAWCHFYDFMACWQANPRKSLELANEQARRAVALDETDCFPRTVRGIVRIFLREYDEARSDMLAALDLNPNDFLARRFYGVFLATVGQAEEAIEQVEMGRRLNPFDTRWVPWNLGIVYFSARRYEDAIAALTQAHKPINEVRGWLAASYAHAGRIAEARATLDEFLNVARTDMAVFPGTRLTRLGGLLALRPGISRPEGLRPPVRRDCARRGSRTEATQVARPSRSHSAESLYLATSFPSLSSSPRQPASRSAAVSPPSSSAICSVNCRRVPDPSATSSMVVSEAEIGVSPRAIV